jgi:HK97 family phage major capsid protein
MSRLSLTVPGVDETSRVDGSRSGGIRAYWEGEADTFTSSKPKFRAIELKAKKLTGLCYATDELLEDTSALGAFVANGFKDEFGFKIDDAIIRGTGAGMPLGILNSGALVSVAKESGQAVDTITSANVMAMFARMFPRSVSKAKWYINQAAWPQIFQLSLAVGTGGIPLFIEPGKIADAPYGALLGRPIVPLEQCAALGDVGDILFGDMSQYLLAAKGGIKADSSMHVLFTTSEMAYRFVLRMDGQPIRKSALTAFKGSDTTSPFLTVAAR